MKKIIRLLVLAAVLVATLCCLSACKTWQDTYVQLAEEGYDVTVRYDTTGGKVANINGTVITDVYSTDGKELNSNGTVDIKIYDPHDPVRGVDNGKPKYQVTKDDHTLIGWYTHRELRTDENGNALDEYGQLCSETGREQGYIYSGLWDFEKDTLKVDPNNKTPNGNYTLTLYAAWAPRVTYEIYYEYVEYGSTVSEGGVVTVDSVEKLQIKLPKWDTSTGKINKNDFPVNQAFAGDTFYEASFTADFSELILDEIVPGSVDLKTGTLDVEGGVIKLYTRWLKGTWYKITNKRILKNNAKEEDVNSNYIIMNDINFGGDALPAAFSSAEFNGQIIGNGHKIYNVSATQSGEQGGLFYAIGKNAKIVDLTIESATYKMVSGATRAGNSYGLLAGVISADAVFENVSIVDSKLVLTSSMNSRVSEYNIGLLCGNPVETGIDISGITLEIENDEGDAQTVTGQLDSDTPNGDITVIFTAK